MTASTTFTMQRQLPFMGLKLGFEHTNEQGSNGV